jgi:hypothetical protein
VCVCVCVCVSDGILCLSCQMPNVGISVAEVTLAAYLNYLEDVVDMVVLCTVVSSIVVYSRNNVDKSFE